ncbi:uncharacterized protein TNCV_3994071 [Trichonephila clavipes]|uniref:Reverse transcriptase Ty1/copia-type domain-containing protein n=1 Tax=Trichonephila clavipes TaxID=2585209 RepID=A0A8X6T8E8_TRICX|nr:uncharacterized protein TNCV_3994071 [Trichonephila clavipes]
MKERKVWDLVDHPDNIKILENRWVYTIKYDENNKIVRYKARLVARGNTQLRDSDFATNRDDRVSMGGFITFIDGTPISSRTFKQKSVSLSTMEAEYVSLTEAAKEFIWLKNDGNIERRAGSQRLPITNCREERHVTRMTLMCRAATSRTLSQELGSFHQDGCIRVSRHRGERTLAACIRHTGTSPGMMVCAAVGYTSRSPLARIDGTWNSARYFSGVLRSVALSFIRDLWNPTLQQDNERPHLVSIVRTYLDTENVRLLPWYARSPDLSPIKNVQSMDAKRLARRHTPVTMVDELWHRVETV